MIPARIIRLDDKVMVEWPPMPERNKHESVAEYVQRLYQYDMSRTIAEVENTEEYFNEIGIIVCFMFNNIRLELNQTVFIEPTTEGKCKIVKI